MSKIEVNTVAPQCGTTLTLGESGDTVTLGTGASQSGFGRNGSVNWQTSIKTATFTAASGEGYFCNTSGGAFTVNLPSSPSVGDIVAIKDYASTFQINSLTIGRGGSNMNGTAADSERNTQNESLTLVYADATKGWIAVEEGTGFVGEGFITATGGTVTCCGDCKIHTFTGPGSFTVSAISAVAANNVVSYQVVAGGGGGGGGAGGSWAGGGGGAGGFREVKTPITPYTASPLDGYSTPGNRITVTATGFPIAVGGGGAGSSCTGTTPGTQGATSTFSSISSAGGGGGGASAGPGSAGGTGGSGGGGGSSCSACRPGGAGNTPPVSPAQGFAGGNSSNGHQPASGGGGATAVGTNSTPGSGNPRAGGAGATTSISGSPVTKSVGGASGNHPNPSPVADGGANTGTGGQGNGGAGPSGPRPGGTGGSGIVIIRYKFQ
jgi:hypothetical protein